MRKILVKTLLSSFIFTAFLSCKNEKAANSQTINPQAANTSIMVISDLHLMDKSLLKSDGKAFQTYLAHDRKLLLESEAILKSVLETVKSKKPSLLLIPGDLTKDGEKVSHLALAQMLKEVQDLGIKVLVINGNHDINNPDALAFNGDVTAKVPSVSAAEFSTIYNNFGYKSAISKDEKSLSYVCEPVKGLCVIALDVCHYEPQETAGSIKEETLAWATTQIKKAKAEGKIILGMMHHGLLEHYKGQKSFFPEYVISDNENAADKLIDAGLEVMFTGHYHAQDITSRTTGNKTIYDIETGSTVTWPCPYRYITLENNKLNITSSRVDKINFQLPQEIDFQNYAKDFIHKGLTQLAAGMLMQKGVPQEAALQLAPTVRNAFMAHYAGDEKPTAQDQQDVQNFIKANATLGNAIGSLWMDVPPTDNTYTIAFRK